MDHRIHSEADLDAALKLLLAADPRFSELMKITGRPPLRRRPDGYAGLAAIICAQQLSTASANAIWGRLAAAFDPFEPAAIAKARPARLARLGLSGAKIRALKEIARAAACGDIVFSALGELSADDAHAALTKLHGIGPWTADIYLLTCLGHADAWPAGDLALQEAARLAFGLHARPNDKQMVALAEAWRPWRGVAARLLWTYYRTVKGREGAPTAANLPPPSRARAKIKAKTNSKRGANGRRA